LCKIRKTNIRKSCLTPLRSCEKNYFCTMKTIFLIILIAFTAIFAQSDILDYWADEVEYSVKDSTISLSGNAKLVYTGITITADTIFYFTDARSMLAFGNAVLIDGTDTLRGEFIAYNIRQRSGKVRHGFLQSAGNTSYYADDIVRTDSAIFAHNALYTTCMFPDQPHSHFYCERIKITPNDRAVARPFVLVVGDAPVVALPFFIIPLDRDRTSGWLPVRWGVTLNGRGDVDNIGYYWAINDYLDLMLAGKVDNFENFLAKAETRYAVKNIVTGNVYTDFSLSDRYMGHQNRWSMSFNHDQNLTPDKNFTLRGSGRLVSDKKYFSQYSDDTTSLLNQDLSSNLALTKRFENIGGHASLSWNRNQNLNRETIEQDLPTTNFTLNNRPLIPLAPLTDGNKNNNNNPIRNLSWSYSYRANQRILERTKTDSSYYRIHRGMSHTIPITMPFNLFNHLRITPNFTVSQSVFDSYRDTAAVIDTIFRELFDTISIDEINFIEYVGKEKKPLLDPNSIFPDTIAWLIHRGDTSWIERRYDTTFFRDPNFDINKAHQVWWNTGVNISTNLYGIFPVKLGRMQGIRHTFSPSVGYTFTPEHELDVRFPTVGGGVTSPSGTKQRQDLSFGINNLFETKILNKPDDDDAETRPSPARTPAERKVSFLSAGARGSYNFEADSQKLSNISVTASIPAPKVSLSYSGNYHPYDMQNNIDMLRPLSHTINITPQLPALSGNIWSGDMIIHEGFQQWGYLDNVWKNNTRDWNITITPRYSYTLTRPNIVSEFRTNKSYNLGAGLSFMLTERWKINWGGTWSFTENKFINQAVALSADLECWDLRLDWYPTGVNEGRIIFVAALKKHRDLKWEQRER